MTIQYNEIFADDQEFALFMVALVAFEYQDELDKVTDFIEGQFTTYSLSADFISQKKAPLKSKLNAKSADLIQAVTNKEPGFLIPSDYNTLSSDETFKAFLEAWSTKDFWKKVEKARSGASLPATPVESPANLPKSRPPSAVLPASKPTTPVAPPKKPISRPPSKMVSPPKDFQLARFVLPVEDTPPADKGQDQEAQKAFVPISPTQGKDESPLYAILNAPGTPKKNPENPTSPLKRVNLKQKIRNMPPEWRKKLLNAAIMGLGAGFVLLALSYALFGAATLVLTVSAITAFVAGGGISLIKLPSSTSEKLAKLIPQSPIGKVLLGVTALAIASLALPVLVGAIMPLAFAVSAALPVLPLVLAAMAIAVGVTALPPILIRGGEVIIKSLRHKVSAKDGTNFNITADISALSAKAPEFLLQSGAMQPRKPLQENSAGELQQANVSKCKLGY